MQYGYFDDDRREYVIDRPDTPRSWSNYLGSTDYGALITNNAGGYSFYRSAALGRHLRLRFNAIPMDQPGRYFYLKDHDSEDFWSASWQPVGKPLGRFRSVCRHGTGYTVIESRYAGIESTSTYFVPLGQPFEYWRLKLENKSKRDRRISVFSYCEFANNWSIQQDLANIQYTQYIARGEMRDGLLRIAINDHLPADPAHFKNNDQGRWSWMGLAGADVVGFDTDRETFLGPYRSYNRPVVVENGACTGSQAFGDNVCGVLQATLVIPARETREILVLVGIGKAEVEGRALFEEFGSTARADRELERVKHHWHSRLEGLRVDTPDPDLNHMINVWNAYNCLITFTWSRAASLVYNGERDGFAYRDTIQDILAVLPLIPDESRARLELMLTGQLSNGGAMPIVLPFAHRPGHETGPGEEHFRSDDCQWLFNAVPAYVAETGDVDFYRRVLPFADQGEATVFGHLRRAIEFNLERSGRHGLPCGLEADWNDCLKLGYHGESLFVAFQLRLALTVYGEIAELLGEPAEGEWARMRREELDRNIQAHCWDGEWFVWAFGEDGTVYGTHKSAEGQVYLNTQVWAVLSGAATPEQRDRCLDTVKDRLFTEYGLMLCDPPFVNTSYHVMRAVLFNTGCKENAGIFNHTQGWAVMAECLRGNGDLAYKYYRAFMPSAFNDRAELRQVEPYVHCQSTHSKYSRKFGVGRLPWLTGTASWAYVSAVQSILGLRPEREGFRIDPCIPSRWPKFSAVRRFRGRTIRITVENPDAVSHGVRSVELNGRSLSEPLLRESELADDNEVRVVLGREKT